MRTKTKLTLAMGGKAQRAREVIEAAESSDEISLTIKGQDARLRLAGRTASRNPVPVSLRMTKTPTPSRVPVPYREGRGVAVRD